MSEPAKNISLRVCLTYASFGLLWILATDWLAIWFTRHIHQIIYFEIAKGALFVGISAGLLYWYVRRQLKYQDEITAASSAANTELRQQRDLLDSFIHSLPGVVYVVDPQRRLLRWNRRFEEVTGRTAEELKVLDAAQLFPAAEAPILQAGMARALTEGTAMVEVSFLNRDGRATPYLFTGVRVMLDGQPCMAGVGLDIRVRKLAEAALRDSEARYRLIVETAEEGIWMIDADNRTSFVNPKMARMLGCTVAQMRERSMFDFMDEEGRAISTANVERRRQGIREQHEFKFLRTDGTPLWALLATNPVHDEAGRYLGALAMVSDVTERKRAEEALRTASERLHLLSQRLIEVQESERRHLARELHDEIGQALTATKLNLEVLAREPEPARTKRIADSIAFVERLLQNVRNLSLDLRPPMLDDLGLVAALRWLLDQHTRTTGRQVDFHHDLAEERFAPTLETTCFRVAQEALTNVTRHSHALNVHVGLHRQHDGLTLSVRDDGRGFDVAEARRSAAAGNSLGLVGMEERVTLAGGRFSVTSSGSTGTELSAWFPLNRAVTIPTDEMA